MIIIMAVLIGVLYATGSYLLMQRSLTRIVLGLALIAHGTNTLLLMSGGRAGEPPFIGSAPDTAFSDPLPQAMALTAIVITFGISAFLLAMAYRSWSTTHVDDVEDDVEDRRIAAMRPEDDLDHIEETPEARDPGEDT